MPLNQIFRTDQDGVKCPNQFQCHTLAGEMLAKCISQAEKWSNQDQPTEVVSICLIQKMLGSRK